MKRFFPVLTVFLAFGCNGANAPSSSTPSLQQAPAATEPKAETNLQPHSEATAPDPVGSLKEIARKLELQVQDYVRFTDLGDGRKGWGRTKSLPSNIQFDVTKTNSLVSPLAGKITWEITNFVDFGLPSKEEALKASLRETKTKRNYWAQFAYQNNQWVLKDLGYHYEADGGRVLGILVGDEKHSTLKSDDKDNGIDFWWKALGGE